MAQLTLDDFPEINPNQQTIKSNAATELLEKLMRENFKQDKIDKSTNGLPIRERNGKKYIGASSLGQCGRYIIYSMKGKNNDVIVTNSTEEAIGGIFNMAVGTAIHGYLQKLLGNREFKVLETSELEVIDDEASVIGHYDWEFGTSNFLTLFVDGDELHNEKIVLEIKSQNVEAFQDMVRYRKQPYLQHKKQVHSYMKGLGAKKAIILYVNKNGRFTKEFEKYLDETGQNFNAVFNEVHLNFDNDIYQAIKEETSTILAHYEAGTTPAYKKIAQCDWPCRLKSMCHTFRDQEKYQEKLTALENKAVKKANNVKENA